MELIDVSAYGPIFDSLEVYDVLQLVEQYKDEYMWSIQELDAYEANTEPITGKNVLELRDICSKSDTGYITDFKTIVELSLAFKHIVDIAIIGCKEESSIYKAGQKGDWAKYGDVYIGYFDGAWWELYSNNPEIMTKFRGLLEENNRLEREIAKKKLKRNLSIISVIIVGLFILIWHLFLTS